MKITQAILKIIVIQLFIVFIFSTLNTQRSYSMKKGFYLGLEGTYGLVYGTTDAYSGDTHVDNGDLYGATLISEYLFTDYLGVALGLGIKYYEAEFKGTLSGVSLSGKYETTLMSMPLTFRLRPLPLFGLNTNFTTYFGVGVDFQLPISSRTSQSGSVNAEKRDDVSASIGLILEGGIGYLITNNFLIQTGVKYNFGLTDIEEDEQTKTTIDFFEFNLSLMYKLF